ncbi:GGDEF domain-containing protein [Sulfurimonas microaerophilic]|uniref:GGDEF domain-containing protein n=1 Tax=Sulfurimonas microaerophilic TaxID=3058392 RepID=UPI002714D276|nr:diguanylate cyclase [Sulfurimonas sp. hsl 1-7]
MMNEYYIYAGIAVILVLIAYIIRLRITINSMQEGKDRLIKEAYFNPVTNLPNRKNIKYVFDEQIDRTLRHNQTFLILAIKMNNYHQLAEQSTELVNEFMYEASNVIIKSTRNEDLVAHIEDDTFIILFNEYLKEDNSHIVIERLQKEFLEDPVDIDASYDISIGLCKYPNDGTDSDTLIEKAIAKAESKQF